MATVSLRVPDELKTKMDEHEAINWSAVIRSNLEDEIARLESRNIGHAVAVSERLSNSVAEDTVADTNTAETIREWRDTRYGEPSTDD